MTKNQFIQVLNRYTESSPEEAQNILALKKAFPYSQVLHALSARLSKDHGLSMQQHELQLAAVYASDRAVLKNVMTRAAAWPASIEVTGAKHSSTPESISVFNEPAAATGDVAEEVIQDLHRLSELKHNFEMMFIDVDEANIPKKRDGHDIPEPVEKKETPDSRKDTANKKNTGKSKAQKIVELAKALQAEEFSSDESEADKKKDDQAEGDIIKEIKTSKKKIKPETEKQREQLQIINQFIKTQPTISNAKDKVVPAPQGDLSTIKSGEFGDNVISETLVEILLKQGKKDKAIEVLKKLIWKFPQKKGYFAAQIEELKK